MVFSKVVYVLIRNYHMKLCLHNKTKVFLYKKSIYQNSSVCHPMMITKIYFNVFEFKDIIQPIIIFFLSLDVVMIVNDPSAPLTTTDVIMCVITKPLPCHVFIPNVSSGTLPRPLLIGGRWR